MALDLDAFPPEVKLALIASGEGFGSNDTLAQADQTLQAMGTHGSIVAAYGVRNSDAARLGEARDLLVEAGYGRGQAKGKKKTLGAGLDDAHKTARTVRLRGRAVLASTLTGLMEQGHKDAAAKAQTTLDLTSDSEKVGEDLAVQLDHLAAAIDPTKSPQAAAAAAECGGPGTLPVLVAAATGLRDAQKNKSTVRGTPAETQRIDLIDGIIIDICRRARDAAEAASKALGDPALLKVFKLDKLYASRSSSAKKDEDATGDGGAAVPPEAPAGGAPEQTPEPG